MKKQIFRTEALLLKGHITEITRTMVQLQSSYSEGKHIWGTQPRAEYQDVLTAWINNEQIQEREPESVYRIKRTLNT